MVVGDGHLDMCGNTGFFWAWRLVGIYVYNGYKGVFILSLHNVSFKQLAVIRTLVRIV